MYPTRSTPRTVGFNMPMGSMPEFKFMDKMHPKGASASPKVAESTPLQKPKQLEIGYSPKRQLQAPTTKPVQALERGGSVPAGSRKVTAGQKPFATGQERDLPRRGPGKGRPGKRTNPKLNEVPRETAGLNERFSEPSFTQQSANRELTESEKVAGHLKTIGLHRMYTKPGSSGVPTATGRPSANEVNKARQALLRQHHPDFATDPADRARRERKSAKINEAADTILRMR